jgi:hypothetical protein
MELTKKPLVFKGAATLAASGTGTITMNVPAEYDFDFTSFSYKAVSAVANIIPFFSFQMVIGQDNIFSDYISADMFSGMRVNTNPAPNLPYEVGQALWFKFDIPYAVPAKSQVNVYLRNDVAQIITVEMAFKGVRRYS